jgi:DNA-binding transcriptional MerR regulator
MQTLRKWESDGLIPHPTIAGGHRYYTGKQVQLIVEFAATALEVRYNKTARDLAVAKKSLETFALWS